MMGFASVIRRTVAFVFRTLVRQAARLIDGQFLHLRGRLLIGTTTRRQRMGHFVAGTVAICHRHKQ